VGGLSWCNENKEGARRQGQQYPEGGSDVAALGGEEGSLWCGEGEDEAGDSAADAESDAESDAANDLVDGEHAGGLRSGHTEENKFGHDRGDPADAEAKDCHHNKYQDERFGCGREDSGGDHHGESRSRVCPPCGDACDQPGIISLQRLRAGVEEQWHHRVDGPSRRVRRQRRDGIVLRPYAKERPRPATMVDPGGITPGDRGLDRANLPPQASATPPRQAHPDRV
jgi:hypothetical protein